MPPVQPTQPPYAPQPQAPQQPHGSQYDFIMNPDQPKGPRRFGGAGGAKPLLVIVGIVALLVIVIVVLFSLLSGGDKDAQSYVKLAQEQQEIARVAGLQYSLVTQQTTKNFAINSKLTMQADEATLLKYLRSHGVKVSTKELIKGTDSTTDTALTTAVSTSSLDAALTNELKDEITDYQTDLKRTYTASTSKTSRAMLTRFYDNAQLLLTQSQQQ